MAAHTEMQMRSIALAAMAAIVLAVAAVPAEAAPKRQQQKEYFDARTMRPEQRVDPRRVRRSPTRITVTRRSYLDAGTEVYPGSMSYTDYVFPPNYIGPAQYILGPGRRDGEPTPGTDPFWNPAYHVPNWGY
jgi:hypothetical protein